MYRNLQRSIIGVLILIVLLLVGCATTQPRPNNVENVCSICYQYPDWYADAKRAQTKWGVPIPVLMAIIYQESSFSARAQPPRKKLLWIIPWKRPTSAYGYSQALKHTWSDYQAQTGNDGGKRHLFADATDFIGWYSNQAHRKLGIPLNNAYALYLAYHEGLTGYADRTYLKKPWLIRVAHKVSARAATYQRQLSGCESKLASRAG